MYVLLGEDLLADMSIVECLCNMGLCVYGSERLECGALALVLTYLSADMYEGCYACVTEEYMLAELMHYEYVAVRVKHALSEAELCALNLDITEELTVIASCNMRNLSIIQIADSVMYCDGALLTGDNIFYPVDLTANVKKASSEVEHMKPGVDANYEDSVKQANEACDKIELRSKGSIHEPCDVNHLDKMATDGVYVRTVMERFGIDNSFDLSKYL